jgi:hypothetical protein
MASIEKNGRLDSFITPTAQGGWGLCEWIIGQMSQNRIYTPQEIYTAIQSSALSSDVKALSLSEIDRIMTWMIGKTITGILVVAGGQGSITTDPYTPQE